jgi:geranylgeranyl pyrophosphate synthase
MDFKLIRDKIQHKKTAALLPNACKRAVISSTAKDNRTTGVL